jgi:fructose-1,6-bisphosphatase/inositol monophosphatase family enzyme
MASPEYDDAFEFSVSLARRVGEEINKAFKERNKFVQTKASVIDLVTETDGRVEKLLIDAITEK